MSWPTSETMTLAATSLMPGIVVRLDVLAKRAEVLLHARLQLAYGLVERIDLVEMQFNEKAVVVAYVAAQCFKEHLARCLQPSLR